MILAQFKNAWYAAVIVCDICQQRISDGGLAVAVFPHVNHESSELLPVLHAHRGPCHHAAEAKLGGNTGQEEISQSPIADGSQLGTVSRGPYRSPEGV